MHKFRAIMQKLQYSPLQDAFTVHTSICIFQNRNIGTGIIQTQFIFVMR